MTTINFWPILVSSVVAFAVGALWYSPILFGKEWMALSKVSDADVAAAKTKGMAWSYLAQFVSTLVSFSVLGFFIAAAGSGTAADGAFIAFIAWIGFIVTTGVSSLLWEKKPWKLFLINMIGTLVNFIIAGAIIGAW